MSIVAYIFLFDLSIVIIKLYLTGIWSTVVAALQSHGGQVRFAGGPSLVIRKQKRATNHTLLVQCWL